MSNLAFRCPICSQAFQVAPDHRGLGVACPHCLGAVAIPAADNGTCAKQDQPLGTMVEAAARGVPEAAFPAPAVVTEPTRKVVQVDGQAYEVRNLTPQQRAAFRRRVNLIGFAITAVILVMVVVGLLLWRG